MGCFLSRSDYSQKKARAEGEFCIFSISSNLFLTKFCRCPPFGSSVVCSWVGASPDKPSHLHKCTKQSWDIVVSDSCHFAYHNSGGQTWLGLVGLRWEGHLWSCLSHTCLSWSWIGLSDVPYLFTWSFLFRRLMDASPQEGLGAAFWNWNSGSPEALF